MFSKIVGNTDTKARLTHAIETGAVSHAYLIEGAAGSGKRTLVSALLAALARSEAPTVVAKIAEGTCPDVHMVVAESDRAYINVGQIRALLDSLLVKPNDLDFHAVVILSAETMNVNAQNALLKQLEEPRSNIFFFLLTENATALLPTIRSRVQLLRMERLSTDEVSAYVQKTSSRARTLAQSDPDGFADILRLADGSIGAALTLLRGNTTKRSGAHDSLAELFELYANRKTADLYIRILTLSAKRDELPNIFSTLLAGFRDLLLVKRKATGDLLFFRDYATPEALVSKLTARRLMHSYDAVQTAIRDCLGNGNLTLLLTTLANALCQTNI